MRNYRVRILVENVDHGPAQASDVHLGTFSAESIDELVAVARKLGDNFAHKTSETPSAVPAAEHQPSE